MEEFDIVVVGAGPAGLMAAREASKKGAKVLLLEKENGFGLKPCGEAVSDQTLQTAGIRSSERRKIILSKAKGCHIYSPNEEKGIKLLAGETGYREGHIIDKPFFLRILAETAATEDVTIWMNSEVKSVIRREGKISGVTFRKQGKIRRVNSKAVIGCDGVNSAVLKDALGISPRPVIPCIQYKMANCKGFEEGILRVYVGQNVAPLGYLWIFPTGETTANVGIGVKGKPARAYLDRFIEKHPDMFEKAQILNVAAAPVPTCGQITDAVDDNLLVCGDASGQVIPLTGGGIHSSLEGGKLAGSFMAEAIAENDTSKNRLNGYWSKYENPWGRRIRDSGKALSAIEALTDEELVELSSLLSGRDIVDLANGFDIARVATIFLSHPTFALKISRTLLS